MFKKILTVAVVIFNFCTIPIIVLLWGYIGAWALLYFIVWLTIFGYVLDKYNLFEYTEEEKAKHAEFAKGKTYLGYDYRYSSEFWRDDATGEIIEV